MTVTITETQYIRPYYYRNVKIVGSTTYVMDRVNANPVTLISFKTSDENPRWKSKVRNHQNATTARTIEHRRQTGGFGSSVARWYRLVSSVPVEQWSEKYGDIFGAIASFDPPPASVAVDNDARGKFFKHAKSAQTAFRSLTAIGELAETLHMIRNPGRALRGGLDDYLKNVMKRSRRAKKSSLSRIVSETWLEHVFGWLPLISDIKSAGEGLNRRLNRFAGSYTRVAGSAYSLTNSFDPTLTQRNSDFTQLEFRKSYLNKVEVLYYGEVRSVCENPRQADMNLFGANWREIVPTAWELIPYSFLADYFTNIGDLLDAWSVRRSDITWVSKSERRTQVVTIPEYRLDRAYTQTVTNVYKWIESYVAPSHFRAVSRKIVRGAANSDLPSIALEIPGLGTKWINMSALLLARNRTRRQLFS